MIEAGVQDRNGKLAEYLRLLRLMAFELDRAMKAIAHRSLSDLEDSVANQKAFSTRLSELSLDLSSAVKERPAVPPALSEEGLVNEIHAASNTLQSLNRNYSALLKLSTHSVEMMVTLFSSYRGQIQEDSGSRPKHQTWSCQI